MELFDFFTSLILLGFSIGVIGYLSMLLVMPIRNSFSGSKGNFRLKRAFKRISDADELIAEKRFDEAIRELRKAVMLDLVPHLDLISGLKEHHQNILSRFLIISEEFGGRIGNIAIVEQLFLDQAELHLDLIRAQTSYHKLRDRRKQSGKDIPNWSKNDYQARISEVKKALQHNQRQLQRELDRLISEIKTPNSETITYH